VFDEAEAAVADWKCLGGVTVKRRKARIALDQSERRPTARSTDEKKMLKSLGGVIRFGANQLAPHSS
jgi:hypothetical protein